MTCAKPVSPATARVAAQLLPMGATSEALALGTGARSAEFGAGVLSFEGCGRIRISDARTEATEQSIISPKDIARFEILAQHASSKSLILRETSSGLQPTDGQQRHWYFLRHSSDNAPTRRPQP